MYRGEWVRTPGRSLDFQFFSPGHDKYGARLFQMRQGLFVRQVLDHESQATLGSQELVRPPQGSALCPWPRETDTESIEMSGLGGVGGADLTTPRDSNETRGTLVFSTGVQGPGECLLRQTEHIQE